MFAMFKTKTKPCQYFELHVPRNSLLQMLQSLISIAPFELYLSPRDVSSLSHCLLVVG